MRYLFWIVCLYLMELSYSRHPGRPRPPLPPPPPPRPVQVSQPLPRQEQQLSILPALQCTSVRAVCQMTTNPSINAGFTVTGDVYLEQRVGCGGPELVRITMRLAGFPSGNSSVHGFHIHVGSEFVSGCESFGPHYNPFNNPHGSPTDPIDRRHVGDLGNVGKNSDGTIYADFYAPSGATLIGTRSIFGRGLVIHAKPDDLGRGGNAGSLASGNAGTRLACCAIRRTQSG